MTTLPTPKTEAEFTKEWLDAQVEKIWFNFNEEFDNIWPDYVNIEDVLVEYGLEDGDEIDDEDFAYYQETGNGAAEDDTIVRFVANLELPSEAIVWIIPGEDMELGKYAREILWEKS